MDIDKASQTVRCSGCNKKLLLVYIKDSTVPQRVKVAAKCPYCVGSSTVQTFEGLLAISPATDEITSSPVRVMDIESQGDMFTYILRKA